MKRRYCDLTLFCKAFNTIEQYSQYHSNPTIKIHRRFRLISLCSPKRCVSFDQLCANTSLFVHYYDYLLLRLPCTK